MQLKKFQEEAIEELKNVFLRLWCSGGYRIPLIFKSPTGSGKTIMTAEFLRRISGDMKFDADKAFVWVSFNDSSYKQSKKSLTKYLDGGAANINLIDLNDLNNGYLRKNDVFFVNWQKIVSRAKENRKLRQDGEANISFDTFITNTHEQEREIVLIVDEAHIAKDTKLAEDIIQIINPRIELHISATPKYIPNSEEERELKAGFISVSHRRVVEEGLIKEKVEVMPGEEIETIEHDKKKDLDELLLDLAIAKKKKLEEEYKKFTSDINPLILIQLPNDEKDKKDTDGQSKLDFTLHYLKALGVDEDEIAVWLSEKKENLEEITRNNSSVNFLIFKQAAATGWDCPRAQILVMFREIKSPVFRTQVIGRTLRMPEAKHYQSSILNRSYLYTSYRRNEIEIEQKKQGDNQFAINKTNLKDDVENIVLPSIFLKRGKYNDLGDSFQKTFIKVANEYFCIGKDDILEKAEKKLQKKGLDMNATTVSRKLIVNAEIDVYDDFIKEIEESEDTLNHEASYQDLKKLYDLLLYREIAQQEEESRKYAPERSWSKLKTAINVWLKEMVGMRSPSLYSIVCNDLEKGDISVLKKVIANALDVYKPIREKEEHDKVIKSREHFTFSLLERYSYTDEYEVLKSERCATSPFYIGKEYIGRDNEEKFIKFLEKQENIEWWFKNGDFGRDHFAVEYINDEGINSLFYPDFIVKQGDKIGIFDTKLGNTAKSAGTRAKGLQVFIKSYNANKYEKWGEYNIEKKYMLWGGIVVQSGGVWKLNSRDEYEFNKRDLKKWKTLEF